MSTKSIHLPYSTCVDSPWLSDRDMRQSLASTPQPSSWRTTTPAATDPLPQDVHVTATCGRDHRSWQIGEAGKLLNATLVVDVFDHLMICQARWVSLKELRLGF